MIYLKTFENFKTEEILTYNLSGQHIWDMRDTMLSLFLFKIREKNTSFDDNGVYVDEYVVDKDLNNLIGLSVNELAENVIGCSESALVTNTRVIEHYITGRETGWKNANHHQLEVSKKYKDSTIGDLLNTVENIITDIENDNNRLSQNKEASKLRIEAKERGLTKREMKKREDIKRQEQERDLKKYNINNGSPLSSSEDIDIKNGTKIEHTKFGKGEVIDSGDKESKVRFEDGEIKRLSNKFIEKFII